MLSLDNLKVANQDENKSDERHSTMLKALAVSHDLLIRNPDLKRIESRSNLKSVFPDFFSTNVSGSVSE